MIAGLSIAKLFLYLLALVAVIVGVYDTSKKDAERNKGAIEIVIAVFVFIFSIWDSLDVYNSDKSKQMSIDSLQRKVDTLGYQIHSLRDTLKSSRDSLMAIGLKIDKTTGRIEIVNEQILKEVLKLNHPGTVLPDSTNYHVVRNGNTLSISPKEGAWGNLYIYTDTAYIKDLMSYNFTPSGGGFGGAEKQFKIGNKTFVGIMSHGFEPVTFNNPLKINLSKHPKQFVIFIEGSTATTKRYLYQDGVTKWIPE